MLLILLPETQAKGLRTFHRCLYKMLDSLDAKIIVSVQDKKLGLWIVFGGEHDFGMHNEKRQ